MQTSAIVGMNFFLWTVTIAVLSVVICTCLVTKMKKSGAGAVKKRTPKLLYIYIIVLGALLPSVLISIKWSGALLGFSLDGKRAPKTIIYKIPVKIGTNVGSRRLTLYSYGTVSLIIIIIAR